MAVKKLIYYDYDRHFRITGTSNGGREGNDVILHYQDVVTWDIYFRRVAGTSNTALDVSDVATWSAAIHSDFTHPATPMVRVLNADIDDSSAAHSNKYNVMSERSRMSLFLASCYKILALMRYRATDIQNSFRINFTASNDNSLYRSFSYSETICSWECPGPQSIACADWVFDGSEDSGSMSACAGSSFPKSFSLGTDIPIGTSPATFDVFGSGFPNCSGRGYVQEWDGSVYQYHTDYFTYSSIIPSGIPFRYTVSGVSWDAGVVSYDYHKSPTSPYCASGKLYMSINSGANIVCARSYSNILDNTLSIQMYIDEILCGPKYAGGFNRPDMPCWPHLYYEGDQLMLFITRSASMYVQYTEVDLTIGCTLSGMVLSVEIETDLGSMGSGGVGSTIHVESGLDGVLPWPVPSCDDTTGHSPCGICFAGFQWYPYESCDGWYVTNGASKYGAGTTLGHTYVKIKVDFSGMLDYSKYQSPTCFINW